MSTSPYTFEDLSTAEGQSVIRQRILDQLTADGQPTASWAPSSAGGAENLRLDMVAGGVAFFIAQRIANMVNGRLLPLATDSAENGFWLTYLGKRFYKLAKRAATFTIQNIVLLTADGGSAQTFKNGELIVASPTTGNRYILTLPEGQTIDTQPGVGVSAPFQAEKSGAAYLDAAGTITTMVTAKAGITCSNAPASIFAATRQTGNSPGTIDGIVVVSVPTYFVLRVRIDTTGSVGSGAWSWSIDGGLTWTAGGVIPAFFDVPAGGRIIFTNHGTPSFLVGSMYALRVNDNFLQRGADAETDEAFRARCSNRHPGRSLIPLKAHIELWAHEASPEVDKVFSDADPNMAGGVVVTVASARGPATVQAQEDVEDYIGPRLSGFQGVAAPTSPAIAGSRSPQETCLVSSASALVIAVGATVYIPKALLQSARDASDVIWNDYLASLPIGGLPGAVVEMERFYTIMGDLGAVDVQSLHLNGIVSDIVLPDRVIAIPFPGLTLKNNLSWVGI